jgi:protein-L-isoaspartate O-methyltransferase
VNNLAMDWQPHARALADTVAHPVSRWHPLLLTVPRHEFVPAWWERAHGAWTAQHGAEDPDTWLENAYQNTTLVTRVGPHRAESAQPGQSAAGRPTSSSTLPGLLVQMNRHAMLGEGMDVLDAGTGTGYGTALLCARLGDGHVTSIDVDPDLTAIATERLAAAGYQPHIEACDAAGSLPGTYDRIIATVSVRPVPASWLTALRPGGRLVTTITGTSAILTADKLEDGRAFGRIERDWAGFMGLRHGPDYPPGGEEPSDAARDEDGEDIRLGPYPLVIPSHAWELETVLSLENPEVTSYYERDREGRTTVWLTHTDGSWARAEAAPGMLPVVHQTGPRRLWDVLDALRARWLVDGAFHVYGAAALIGDDGSIDLRRGGWRCVIPAE